MHLVYLEIPIFWYIRSSLNINFILEESTSYEIFRNILLFINLALFACLFVCFHGRMWFNSAVYQLYSFLNWYYPNLSVFSQLRFSNLKKKSIYLTYLHLSMVHCFCFALYITFKKSNAKLRSSSL